MKIALSLSERAKGFTEPNPLVGAVAVKKGRILGTGYHHFFGGAHAERIALTGIRETGTTLFVTLEPCAHFGKTPPCVDWLIRKNVARVVVAIPDPNPLVCGRGIQRLRERGIQVQVGLFQEEAGRINRHYLKFMIHNRPYVTIKAGISLDGKMSDKQRRSQWVTSSLQRQVAHSLRGEFSAILAGRRTIMEDDPQLTVRERAWSGKKLFRVVLDSRNQLSVTHKIFRDQARFPLIIFSSERAANKEKKTARHFFIEEDAFGLDLDQALQILARQGIASVLVEGGGQVIDSFLSQNLFDEAILFTAAKFLGGKEAVELFSCGVDGLAKAIAITRVEITPVTDGFILRGFK